MCSYWWCNGTRVSDMRQVISHCNGSQTRVTSYSIFNLDQVLWLRALLDLWRASSTCLKWWLGPVRWQTNPSVTTLVTDKGHIIFTLDQLLWLKALLDLWRVSSTTCLKWWLGPMRWQTHPSVPTWFFPLHETSHQSLQWVTETRVTSYSIFTLDQLLWLRALLDLLRVSSTCLKWWLGPMRWQVTDPSPCSNMVLPTPWDKSSVIAMGYRQGSYHIQYSL